MEGQNDTAKNDATIEDFFADPADLFDLLSSKGRVKTQEEIEEGRGYHKEMTPEEIARARTKDKRDSL